MKTLDKIIIILALLLLTVFSIVSYKKMAWQLRVDQLDLGEARWSEWHYRKNYNECRDDNPNWKPSRNIYENIK